MIDIRGPFHSHACHMLSTTESPAENDRGRKYFWRRLSLSHISPLNRTQGGWFLFPTQSSPRCVLRSSVRNAAKRVFENSARGMLVQDRMPFTLSFWPLFFAYCLLSLVLLSCQGELQRSCSQTVAKTASEQCQLACHCRRYPPLPPPPPPPPPPRPLETSAVEPMAPLSRPWWMGMEIVVLGTVCCASVMFLLSVLIICYKAIKRKPLRKEENGSSRGEYAMSLRNKKKAVGTNNTVV